MNLKPRSENGIYELRYNGRRISTGERDYEKAKRAAKVIIQNEGKKPSRRGSRWTLGEALKDTYERIWQHSKSEKEVRYRIGKMSREDGHVDCLDIDYAWLNAYVEKLRERGESNATINRKLSCISKALGEAVKLGFVDARPPIPKQRETSKKLRWVNHEEQRHLSEETVNLFPRPEAEFMAALIHSLAYTGARISEFIKAVRLGSYNTRQMTFLDTKNGRDRAIPLVPQIMPFVKICESFVLDWPKVNVNWCERRFARLRNHCGYPDVTLHTLRHTCASRQVQAGVDLYRVRDWLGHSSITTTERYAHLAPSSLNTATAHLVPPVEVPTTAGTKGVKLEIVR